MCNPPFHSSIEEAIKGSERKTKGLNQNSSDKIEFNFGGKNAELWCKGGELEFIKRMIDQSVDKQDNCLWFTTLVSKKENLAEIYKKLDLVGVKEKRTIEMQHGHKHSRIVAWTFHLKNQKGSWAKSRWK